VKIDVVREQDIFGKLAGVAHEQHAKRMLASAIAFEHRDERVFVHAILRIVDRRTGIGEKM